MADVAVIVTVYNKEAYLRDTIESVISQKTSHSILLLLSDDSSSDTSRAICAEYAARPQLPHCRILDITDGRHRGVVGNFIYCLEYALKVGVRYFSQLDSDDMFADACFLERQLTQLEQTPEAQAVCSSFFMVSATDNLEEARNKFQNVCKVEVPYKRLNISTESLLSKNNPLVAGGVTYRAEHIDSFLKQFACSDDATQDLPLWLFLSAKGVFWGCNQPSLAYRNLAESVSRSENIDSQIMFQQASLNTRLRFIEYLELQDNNIPALDIERCKKNAHILFALKKLRHYAKLSPKNFRGQLIESLKKYPRLVFYRDLWRALGVYIKNSFPFNAA